LVPSLTKALLPQLLSLAMWPALERLLGVPNFFHLKGMEATVLGDLQCCRLFFGALPRSVPRNNPVSELYGQFLRPHAFAFQLGDLIQTGVCLSKSCPIQFTTVDSNQVVETSQGWSMETACTWGQFQVS
jgi:hypothetical protein